LVKRRNLMVEDQVQNKVLLAAIILAVVCLVLAISSGIAASKNKVSLQREMALRMETEEKLAGTTSKSSSLETELKSAQEQLAEVKAALEQEKLTSQALKNELDKVTKLKEQLERDLKEALFSKNPAAAAVAAGQAAQK
jgi:septal ring factor EnvC (AmiA/AmiB activator)